MWSQTDDICPSGTVTNRVSLPLATSSKLENAVLEVSSAASCAAEPAHKYPLDEGMCLLIGRFVLCLNSTSVCPMAWPVPPWAARSAPSAGSWAGSSGTSSPHPQNSLWSRAHLPQREFSFVWNHPDTQTLMVHDPSFFFCFFVFFFQIEDSMILWFQPSIPLGFRWSLKKHRIQAAEITLLTFSL